MVSWESPPLPPQVAVARQLPLVGRRLELATLEGAWEEAEEGRRQVVFLGGEPGAGKTRLATEVAAALFEHDVTVLVGASTRDLGVPYQPFAEMLDRLFTSVDEDALTEVVAEDGLELRRLSSHVGARSTHPDDLPPSGPGQVRRDLFDAVARLLRRMAERRPLALILEDLHWAQLPTVALLEHVVKACPDSRMLLLATFRTTVPDRSDEVASRLAELHRLEGVRRLDLDGLDTEAIAEYVSLRGGLDSRAARSVAALLRDRTGGNPFFLRELWGQLQARGGVTALRSTHAVPSSIGDTLAVRLHDLDDDVRRVIEVAAVLGDTFDLVTVVAASESPQGETIAAVDTAGAAGLIEPLGARSGRYVFVHSLTRSAVLDRLPPSRRMTLHADAARALERQPRHASLVPRLAHHYLEAHALGFHDEALAYAREAGALAERSLAFEEAARWFEQAADLPDCDPSTRVELLLVAAFDYVRACHFDKARALYERLAVVGTPEVRLQAAMGYEDASWRTGAPDARAADLLSRGLEECELDRRDPRYVRALGSLGRALAMIGDIGRARQVGERAIALARALGDAATVTHAVTTSLWHGITPDAAERQHDRAAEATRTARAANDYETLGSAANFRATVSYLSGRPDELAEAIADSGRSTRATGQPYYRFVYCCLAQAEAFRRGDFAEAQRWAQETLEQQDTLGDDMTEGPFGVQMFMIHRETGGLGHFAPYLDGSEEFAGRWVPGLLALYTELGLERGIRRALHLLTDRDLTGRTHEAQWPMELVFMVEGALALEDSDAVRRLRPLVAEYAGLNLVCGTLIATFGSADRYLGRIAGFLGDHRSAERHFVAARRMDERMRSVVHMAQTLAHHARFLADAGRHEQADLLAQQARELAEPIGQERVLRLLASLERTAGPDGLTERELDVLRLLSTGLSNREIGARLHISAHTAANHVRSILMKTGAANRTQAATYAVRHQLA